jgi:tRNA pseudouridine55 synthase
MARKQEGPVVSGFLNINKVPGMTSMDVLRTLKRLTGQAKVGHGGTLDPDAAGVLPVCMGRATRFIDLVVDGHKQYTMTVRLGEATDTYDASGEVTATSDSSSITRARVEAELAAFRGEIEQVPPMYSAIKQQGQPLYKLARRGVEVERQPRSVTVVSLTMSDWSPPEFTLEVECGRGFYARSLAHDLGLAMGGAAHLLSLVRGRVGPFGLDDSSTPDEFEARVKLGNWQELLYPVDFVLTHLPALVVNPLNEEQVSNGQPFRAAGHDVHEPGPGQKARIYSREGHLVAIARYDPAGSWWRPERVINPA